MNQLITPHHYTAWQLLKAYWQSEERRHAYLLLIIIIILTSSLVAFNVALSFWSNYFFNAIQAYDKRSTFILLGVFCLLAFFYVILAVYRYYLSQLFALRWRRWLTEQLINRWLAKRDYYYLENFDIKTDNPDQRIQEDIGALVTYSLNLFMGSIGAVLTISGFTYVLWQLSNIIQISLGPLGTWHIHGYLVWIAILYAVIGTFITFKIGFPLVSLNFEQQRREANFRFAAIDIRTHAEHIALYNGETHQKNILQRLFTSVLENWYLIIKRQKLLIWFTSGYNQIAIILPVLAALPNYFNKVFLLGGITQSMRAFDGIQDGLAFLINSYTDIAQWRAISRRLITFLNHMQEIDENVHQKNHLVVEKTPGTTIIVDQLSISTPRGESLLKDIHEALPHGQHYLIKGYSGIGKSTFIRTLAGIWPFASGKIRLPTQQKLMYLPQKPYIPIGTLAEAILFPDHINGNDQRLKQILQDCRLENFIPRLHETATWSEQMSPGEQQRLAFARVLLQKPDWVFLDESTSMLDLENEAYLYQLLKSCLPQCSIVSVGHRPSLENIHDRVIDMAKYSA